MYYIRGQVVNMYLFNIYPSLVNANLKFLLLNQVDLRLNIKAVSKFS